MATPCVPQLDFGFQVETTARFDGGSLTSDAGLLVLREFDHHFRLSEDLAGTYRDRRRADRGRTFRPRCCASASTRS
jgi:hypothetical protein